MSEALEALSSGTRVGTIRYAKDRLLFEYADPWRADRNSFPLSLSMPMTQREHGDTVVRAFLTGLLPDNDEVLRRWGQRFHVSPRNPFRILFHVGEECAGAIQYISPERSERWLAGKAEEGVRWLTKGELIERVAELTTDHGKARRIGDEGHFSLAGAQAKTGLYFDRESRRWGIPRGATPTTHIIKPNIGKYGGYELNEHFCLQLARRLGLRAAESWTERIGKIPVIIVKRFDRILLEDRVVRIHQEDACQALGRMPEHKYENQGGPSAKEIFDLMRHHSSKFQEDVNHFLDAIIYQWLIGGTDAHAKNYGFLLAGGGQVRLAPLYDLSSCLPYPQDVPSRKAKLAMKIGGEYHLSRIGPHQWRKAARAWSLKSEFVFERIRKMSETIPQAARDVGLTIGERGHTDRKLVHELENQIIERAGKCLQDFQA